MYQSNAIGVCAELLTGNALHRRGSVEHSLLNIPQCSVDVFLSRGHLINDRRRKRRLPQVLKPAFLLALGRHDFRGCGKTHLYFVRDEIEGGMRGNQDEQEEVFSYIPDRKSTRLNSSHRCISYA